VTVFEDKLSITGEDVLHPERTFIIGMSKRERTLYCVFVERGEDETRIISSRRVTPHERRRYEEG
jgi:uncharacterized DUF497 family protein